MPSGPVSELLARWKGGDAQALEALVPLVYQELHELAHRFLRRERPGHTLQSTALVHEAYLRLVDQGPVDTRDRAHFVAVAARLMRQILVDHARRHGAAKRGADRRVDLDAAADVADARSAGEGEGGPGGRGADLVALDDALSGLSRLDERQSRIVELRYFGGMTNEETALVLGISPATVKREWNVAKAWLSREIRRGQDDPSGDVPKG
jgi:RNA polymerase sigma factor (TIGR02999 family)